MPLFARPAFLAFTLCAAVAAAGLTATVSPALAQSSTTTTVNGVTIKVVGSGSQSVSPTSDGARIVLNGEEIVITGNTITVGGVSFEQGPFETVTINNSNGELTVSVDGKVIFTRTAEGSDTDEGSRLNDEAVAYFNGDEVPQDYARALELFEQAYVLGNAFAADNLANIYWNALANVAEDRRRAVGYAELGAAGGRPKSQYYLGLAYLEGNLGPAANGARAVELLTAAAEQEHTGAMNQLGILLANGQHVATDLERSTELYRRAAELGNEAAQNNYAFALWNGKGTAQNPPEALRYAEMAAEAGFNSAQFLVGVINFFGGDGVTIDKPRAAEMFLAAAENGHDVAAFNIAIMLRDGDGVAQDLGRALAWMKVAAERGYAAAEADVEKLEAMLAEQAAETPDYWYVENGQQQGPVTLSALKAVLAGAGFSPDTLVWKKGMPDWVAARTLPELE